MNRDIPGNDFCGKPWRMEPIRMKIDDNVNSGKKSSTKKKLHYEPIRMKINPSTSDKSSVRKTLNFHSTKEITSVSKSLAPTPLVVKPTIRKKLRFTSKGGNITSASASKVTFKVPEVPKIIVSETKELSLDASTQTEPSEPTSEPSSTKTKPSDGNDMDEFLFYESKINKNVTNILHDKLELILDKVSKIEVEMSELRKEFAKVKKPSEAEEKENTPPKTPRSSKIISTQPSTTNFTPKPPNSKLRGTIGKYNLLKSEFNGILGTPNFDVDEDGISVKFKKNTSSYSTALLQQLHMLENTPAKK